MGSTTIIGEIRLMPPCHDARAKRHQFPSRPADRSPQVRRFRPFFPRGSVIVICTLLLGFFSAAQGVNQQHQAVRSFPTQHS
jgi:hypothetical protein